MNKQVVESFMANGQNVEVLVSGIIFNGKIVRDYEAIRAGYVIVQNYREDMNGTIVSVDHIAAINEAPPA